MTAAPIVDRAVLERREHDLLAPYAVRGLDSRGRRYPERDDLFRTPFQRDHDRIIHSAAYRRLGNKTQVFISFEGEHYRTRLTHTEEATQIAVSVARALAVNVDLTAAISRAHDLGHAPFGHAGEDALAAKMAAFGGFEHNLQTLRIVDELEVEYPEFPGLNLTYEVRDGITAHRGDADIGDPLVVSIPGEPGRRLPSIEAQIADVADEIAYSCHDLQDGLASGLVRREDIVAAAPLWWSEASMAAAERHATTPDLERRRIKGYLIDRLVSDLIAATATRLAGADLRSAEAVRALPSRVVEFSPEMRAMRDDLHAYLLAHLYRHFEVVTMGEKAKRLLSDLFDAYCANLRQLPASVAPRLAAGVPPERAICDHIASMTDRGALREHQRLYDVDALVL